MIDSAFKALTHGWECVNSAIKTFFTKIDFSLTWLVFIWGLAYPVCIPWHNEDRLKDESCSSMVYNNNRCYLSCWKQTLIQLWPFAFSSNLIVLNLNN